MLQLYHPYGFSRLIGQSCWLERSVHIRSSWYRAVLPSNGLCLHFIGQAMGKGQGLL